MRMIIILCLCTCFQLYAQTPRQLENIEAFNRMFGYVKCFHPSDEAAKVDWGKFAVYGSKEIEKCKNSTELLKTLNELFLPIAPTVKITKSSAGTTFSMASLTPSESANLQTITWQHEGVRLSNSRSVYSSERLNRKREKIPGSGFCTITANVELKDHRSKEFILTASVKLPEGPGSAHLWARVDREDRTPGFFQNMDDRPIVSPDWAVYEIKGTIDGNGTRLAFGCFLKGAGKLLVDDLYLKVRDGNEWKTIYTNSFETDEADAFPKSMEGRYYPPGYRVFVTGEEGKKSVAIQGEAVNELGPIFKRYCEVGEYTKKDIGSGLTAMIPLALYGTESFTYPKANAEKLSALENQLKNTSTESVMDLYVRLADIIMTWNVFQHFYPYFDVVKTDWNAAFITAIREAYTNKTEYDFVITLRRFTAQLKDGHVWVSSPSAMAAEGYVLPLEWEWIENRLVITNVLADDLPVKAGDIVMAIDRVAAEEYFQQIYPTISAATSGWLHYRAQMVASQGSENSKVVLSISDAQLERKEAMVIRNLSTSKYYALLKTRKNGYQLEKIMENEPIRKISDGIFYINIGEAPPEHIKLWLPQFQDAKALICDLRGYPRGNHELISYFLQQNDTSSRWMRIPQIIYPDQENITGYREMGWDMKPLQPHLSAKVFFIIDGRAISYAESFLSFIEHYKLATIIGQPSAGTNGNVNPFWLPGKIQISWTGMKVLKHDGSQHHGIGIVPNVYVQRTIKGVREHRDEFLDKAIELAGKVE